MRGDVFFRENAARPPFSRLHPKMAGFFKEYLAHEKVTSFGDQIVLNTNFPPFPSPAFDHLVENFSQLGETTRRTLYSVVLGMTNRCEFRCWHCYNVGRSTTDIPLDTFAKVVPEIQNMGAVMITLTGGEPLLRDDLEDIVALFDQRSCLLLGTTGAGLTPKRAMTLREKGLFAVGISLDSVNEDEHDRLRGVKGAFQIALRGLQTASDAGLYPYVVAVATREFLRPDHFRRYMRFVADAGAKEVHLLEPSATGQLAGRTDVLLKEPERKLIFQYQEEVAGDESLPILSSYSYLESSDTFGCGAGLTHFYIDGSGEVCPCQLVPMSFGNVTKEPFGEILNRMGCHFVKPRAVCAGRSLGKHIPPGQLPTCPKLSMELCEKHLAKEHDIPKFFRIRQESQSEVGRSELQAAYDHVHGDYDAFWLTEASKPTEELAALLPLESCRKVFEAGCGTGYGTAILASRVPPDGEIIAADLSEGMLAEARKRLAAAGHRHVHFIAGDALELLKAEKPLDLVFTSWVLGYIPLKPFFAAATGALREGGAAGVCGSPRELAARGVGDFWRDRRRRSLRPS